MLKLPFKQVLIWGVTIFIEFLGPEDDCFVWTKPPQYKRDENNGIQEVLLCL